MGFKNGFSTFMNTEKESEKWHTGIFRGIKVGIKTHDPRKVRKALMATKYPLTRQGALDYYHNDEHYHDVPALFLYGVTTAIEIGAFGYGIQKLLPLITAFTAA